MKKPPTFLVRLVSVLSGLFLIFGAFGEAYSQGPVIEPDQTAALGDLVISQIYAAGGTAGATYKYCFVEVFNRGSSPVTVHSLNVAIGIGSSAVDRSFGGSSSQGYTIRPGQFYLIKMASGGASGADLPTPDIDASAVPPPPFPSSFFGTSAKMALLGDGSDNSVFADCPLATPGLLDFVGFGSTNCFAGSGPMTGLTNTKAAFRKANGCTFTSDNAQDFTLAAPSPRNSLSPFSPCVTAPTQVLIRGQISTTSKVDMRTARVTLTDQQGNSRYALPTVSGTYSFYNVPTGQTYTVTATAKNNTYDPRSITPAADLTTVDFVPR